MKRKLLFLVTEDWFFCSHFFERAQAAKLAGYQVSVVTRESKHAKKIRDAGFNLIPIEFNRRGLNPLKELYTLWNLIFIYLRERPDIVHHIAAKPILYGTLSAIASRRPKILNDPVGMGYIFSTNNIATRLLRPFLRFGYHFLLNPNKSKVVFENNDDLNHFVNVRAVKSQNAILIRGAGIDLTKFEFRGKEPFGIPVITLLSRMLWDKGIAEFIAAAQMLNEEGIEARFVLVGMPDIDNPSAIPVEQLNLWSRRFNIEWWGWQDDVVGVWNKTHIACLPSYREGLPKSLLEAAAIGLPIVTTDAIGCREVVNDGDNGFIVPIKNSKLLAGQLRKLIFDSKLRQEMGKKSRVMVEKKFSSEKIIEETLSVYSELLML